MGGREGERSGGGRQGVREEVKEGGREGREGGRQERREGGRGARKDRGGTLTRTVI